MGGESGPVRLPPSAYGVGPRHQVIRFPNNLSYQDGPPAPSTPERTPDEFTSTNSLRNEGSSNSIAQSASNDTSKESEVYFIDGQEAPIYVGPGYPHPPTLARPSLPEAQKIQHSNVVASAASVTEQSPYSYDQYYSPLPHHTACENSRDFLSGNQTLNGLGPTTAPRAPVLDSAHASQAPWTPRMPHPAVPAYRTQEHVEQQTSSFPAVLQQGVYSYNPLCLHPLDEGVHPSHYVENGLLQMPGAVSHLPNLNEQMAAGMVYQPIASFEDGNEPVLIPHPHPESVQEVLHQPESPVVFFSGGSGEEGDSTFVGNADAGRTYDAKGNRVAKKLRKKQKAEESRQKKEKSEQTRSEEKQRKLLLEKQKNDLVNAVRIVDAKQEERMEKGAAKEPRRFKKSHLEAASLKQAQDELQGKTASKVKGESKVQKLERKYESEDISSLKNRELVYKKTIVELQEMLQLEMAKLELLQVVLAKRQTG